MTNIGKLLVFIDEPINVYGETTDLNINIATSLYIPNIRSVEEKVVHEDNLTRIR